MDEFCDKEKLFAYTSIAEWILPAVYAGHLGCVVWIKPPWSSQMNDGEYALVVGRDSDTGHIRLLNNNVLPLLINNFYPYSNFFSPTH